MIISQTERILLDASAQIGTVADSNCRFTHMVAARIDSTGTPLLNFSVGELLTLLDSCIAQFNRADVRNAEEGNHD